MVPSMPRSTASCEYSGLGPETMVGAVMLSLNSTAVSFAAATTAGASSASSASRTCTFLPLSTSPSGAKCWKPSRFTVSP